MHLNVNIWGCNWDVVRSEDDGHDELMMINEDLLLLMCTIFHRARVRRYWMLTLSTTGSAHCACCVYILTACSRLPPMRLSLCSTVSNIWWCQGISLCIVYVFEYFTHSSILWNLDMLGTCQQLHFCYCFKFDFKLQTRNFGQSPTWVRPAP